MSRFGVLGVNVGPVGRWVRLILGFLVLLFVASDFYPASHAHDESFYIRLIVSLAVIIAAFTVAHALIGDRLAGKSPWWGTLIFVVPTMFLIVAPELNPQMQPGHWLGYPEINHPFRLALMSYIGMAFIFQWRDRYGGCEAVAIPNFIIRKNYGSYCIPLLPLDAAEKFLADRSG